MVSRFGRHDGLHPAVIEDGADIENDAMPGGLGGDGECERQEQEQGWDGAIAHGWPLLGKSREGEANSLI